MTEDQTRKPGEAFFAVLLSVGSIAAVWNAYGISGFESLSSPGAFPMAVAATMAITSIIIAVRTLQKPADRHATFWVDVLPIPAAIITVFIVLYAIALRPLGFLPTSLIFLFVTILLLSRKGIIFSASVSVISLFFIYIVFRLVFSVLMPEGVVPEREILAFFGNLFGGFTK